MQQKFIDRVIEEVWPEDDKDLQNFIFILPSRRAGIFLKNAIAQKTVQTVFAPEIYSIEQFIEKVSGLSYASATEQLFTLYQAYQQVLDESQDNFYDFSKWARTLLMDFDEIDRYLIPHQKIFSYLTAISEINHWSVGKEQTPLIKDYIKFWNGLEPLYLKFRELLLDQDKAHQGLVYRIAWERLDTYIRSSGSSRHIFLGFNALNEAESQIIQTMLGTRTAEVFWDLDQYFLDESYHDAGFFIRRHLKHWPHYRKNSLQGINNDFLNPKDIRVIGLPKNVSQVKYTGQILNELSNNKSDPFQNTAVILGDESLLNPLLNSLPPQVDRLNITMGFPLKSTPLASVFNHFFDLFLVEDPRGWYHTKITSFTALPYIQLLLSDEEKLSVAKLLNEVQGKNLIYLNRDHLKLYPEKYSSILFASGNFSVPGFLQNTISLIRLLHNVLKDRGSDMELEYLYAFYRIFNQLKEMTSLYPFIVDIRTLKSLFSELLAQETIDFQGEPLEGLQLMGMLESRVLDFETVIITSVNEGIIPSGKQQNSFIPYDVKKELGLPTYKEKDAVYTYHFYRLLQRAKNIFLLYNTEPDVLMGGEKSRLISQLLTDKNISAYINQQLAIMGIEHDLAKTRVIDKNEDLCEEIKRLAASGFSPTSLARYIQDPIDFYKKSILKIEDMETVEDTIAANTFGTVIHNSMEELFSPLVGEYLSPDSLMALKPKIAAVIRKYFIQFYDESSLLKGKNSIAYQVLIRYVENFLDSEIHKSQTNKIKIISLEKRMEVSLDIPGLAFPVTIKGTIDRIDEVNGRMRIVDYKTGKVTAGEMKIASWEDIIEDPGKSKVFQVMCYGIMHGLPSKDSSFDAGVISFKNMRAGFLSFGLKSEKGGRNMSTSVDTAILEAFREQLYALIREICDSGIPFREKTS